MYARATVHDKYIFDYILNTPKLVNKNIFESSYLAFSLFFAYIWEHFYLIQCYQGNLRASQDLDFVFATASVDPTSGG